MSGFKDDVLNILRDNVLLHGEAMGLVQFHTELLKELQSRKFPVTDTASKPVFLFDYVVISEPYVALPTVLWAMTVLSSLGIIILDVTSWKNEFQKEYKVAFGGFMAHRINYEDRYYVVIHKGTDYGN